MNITFENITLEEAIKIIEFASQPKKDEIEKAAKKVARTGQRSYLQEYLKLRRNYLEQAVADLRPEFKEKEDE